MSRRQVVTVIDDDDSNTPSPAVAGRTRSATQHDSRASSAPTEPRRAGSARRKVRARPGNAAGRAERQTGSVRRRETPDVTTVVDLTKNSPSDDQDDVMLVSVSQPSQQLSGSMLMAGCRRLSSAAAAAIPSIGAGPFASKQQRTKHKDSPSPIAVPEHPTRSAPQCGVCMENLKDPACGTCGHIYCEVCLRDAVKVQKKCPTCRKAMQPRQIRRVYL